MCTEHLGTGPVHVENLDVFQPLVLVFINDLNYYYNGSPKMIV